MPRWISTPTKNNNGDRSKLGELRTNRRYFGVGIVKSRSTSSYYPGFKMLFLQIVASTISGLLLPGLHTA